MLLVGQLVFLLQIITETSYSFGAVFFLQYCNNTLLAGVLIFLGRGWWCVILMSSTHIMRWEIIAGWFVIRCLAGQYVVWYKTPDASDYYNKDEASFVLTNRLFRRFFLGWFIVCQMIIKKVVLITKPEIICLHIFILLIFCILCIAGSSLQSKLYDEYFLFSFFPVIWWWPASF